MLLNLKQRLHQDFPRLAFAGAFLMSVGATIVVMGGLAALTNFCLTNQPLGLGIGFKLYPPYTVFSTEVMRIQRASVSTTSGAFSCGRFFRFDWTLWAMQVVWLCIVGLVWHRCTICKYKSALWATGASITAWHMYKADYIISMDYWTQGEMHTTGIITAGGLIFTCIGNFLMMFAGNAYAEVEHPHANNTSRLDLKQPSTTDNGAGFIASVDVV